MRVFLDDDRDTPTGWVRAHTAQGTILLLQHNEVTHLSLDHDLGDEALVGNGYHVLLWLEDQVAAGKINPPDHIYIHSANAGARTKMELAIQSINRLLEARNKQNQDPAMFLTAWPK